MSVIFSKYSCFLHQKTDRHDITDIIESGVKYHNPRLLWHPCGVTFNRSISDDLTKLLGIKQNRVHTKDCCPIGQYTCNSFANDLTVKDKRKVTWRTWPQTRCC